MVFVLLIKMVAFFVRVPIIEFRVSDLKMLIRGVFSSLYWKKEQSQLMTVFYVRLGKLPKQIIGSCQSSNKKGS